MKSARLLLGWVLLALAVGWSQVGLSQGETLASVGERSNPVAQTIVEAMRSATGAEMALLGAAFFNESAAVPATASRRTTSSSRSRTPTTRWWC